MENPEVVFTCSDNQVPHPQMMRQMIVATFDMLNYLIRDF